MNKIFLNSVVSLVIFSAAMDAYSSGSTEVCNSGPYEISGVLKTPDGGFAESAVIVNGCYTFSNKENGSYRLRFKYLWQGDPAKAVIVQIFTFSYGNYKAEMPIGSGTIYHDVTVPSENSSGGNGSLAWSFAGEIDGYSCVNLFENGDPAWDDNYLCFSKPFNQEGGGKVKWDVEGRPPAEDWPHCVNIAEPGDPNYGKWSDNHLCTTQDIGLEWSVAGPIKGKQCINIQEPNNPNNWAWYDNYLCYNPW